MHQVLVLNQDYAPLQIAAIRRAFVLVDRGKAEALEFVDTPIRTPVTKVITLGHPSFGYCLSSSGRDLVRS